MCRLRNIALESVTDRRTDRQTDGWTDKVIPMCPYASQATQKQRLSENNEVGREATKLK